MMCVANGMGRCWKQKYWCVLCRCQDVFVGVSVLLSVGGMRQGNDLMIKVKSNSFCFGMPAEAK